MASGWLNHKQFHIIKGIGKLPTDTYSAENDPVIVNLMSGLISLVEWTPNIPAVKNGGVWVDSPLSDGRQLLAAASGNVIEKVTILITDNSYLGAIKALSGLNQISLDCRDYWQTEYQIDPVYVMWYAGCGAGPQYALLSNIELAPEYLDSPSPTIRVNVTLEREPYWRGIPPGANPKLWTFYVNNQAIGTNKTLANALLVTGTDDLINQSIRNKYEWVATNYGLQTTALTKNYVTIPGSLIPGDAPALVSLGLSSNNDTANVYIGHTTKKYAGVGHDGISRAVALTLNAGDGNTASTITKTGGTVNEGVVSNGDGIGLYTYGQRTVTGVDANFVTAVGWGGATGAKGIKLDRQLYRGTYAIFCRATNNSAAPVLTDMRMRIFIEEFEDNANQYISSITLPEVNVPLTITNPAWIASYMGTVTLPLSTRAVVSPLGYGIQLQDANSNIRISLQLKVDVATANRIFRIIDLILFPIDEGIVQVLANVNTTFTPGQCLIDNTGYLNRGQVRQSATIYQTNSNSGGVSLELKGQDITLNPKVDQRLYFLENDYFAAGTETALNTVINVALNIVPRWSGIRDV